MRFGFFSWFLNFHLVVTSYRRWAVIGRRDDIIGKVGNFYMRPWMTNVLKMVTLDSDRLIYSFFSGDLVCVGGCINELHSD